MLCIATIATPAGEPLGLGPEVQTALEDNLVGAKPAPREKAPVKLEPAGS